MSIILTALEKKEKHHQHFKYENSITTSGKLPSKEGDMPIEFDGNINLSGSQTTPGIRAGMQKATERKQNKSGWATKLILRCTIHNHNSQSINILQ